MNEYGPMAAWQDLGLPLVTEFRPGGPPEKAWLAGDILAIEAGRYVLANNDLTGNIAGMAIAGYRGENKEVDAALFNASNLFVMPFNGVVGDEHVGRAYGVTRLSPGVWAVEPTKEGSAARLHIRRFVRDVFTQTGSVVTFESFAAGDANAGSQFRPGNFTAQGAPILALVKFLPPFGSYHPSFY